jgi:glutamine amidotransferase
MARLFGLIGNRADLAGRVLKAERQALAVAAKGQPVGWGLGFYQGGEVLMRKRPIDDHAVVDFGEVASDVRGDVVVGHVRTATVGSLRTENTHPFRYRQWVFAMTGTVSQFSLVRDRLHESVPEFLRSGIRGETDSEIVFHIFLSFLHDQGVLSERVVPSEIVSKALRATLAVVDGISAEVGGAPTTTNMLLTDGEYVCALHRGAAMGYRLFAGKNDVDHLIGDDFKLKQKTPEPGSVRFALVASDFDGAIPKPWKTFDPNCVITLRAGVDPVVEQL